MRPNIIQTFILTGKDRLKGKSMLWNICPMRYIFCDNVSRGVANQH